MKKMSKCHEAAFEPNNTTLCLLGLCWTLLASLIVFFLHKICRNRSMEHLGLALQEAMTSETRLRQFWASPHITESSITKVRLDLDEKRK